MTALLQRFRWESLLLARNNLVTISVVVTLVYIGIFQLLKLLGHVELISMVMVLNDPAMIGMLFIGITVIFEREQGTLAALQVTPMNLHHYLAAKIVTLSVLGTVCGYAMAVASVGWNFEQFHFTATLFLISMSYSILGILLVAGARQFVTFALYASGTIVLTFLPLFDWMGVFPVPGKEIFPLEHALRLLGWSYDFQMDHFPWYSYPVLIAFNALTYVWAYRRFSKFNRR